MRIFLIVPGGVDRSGQERVIPVLLNLIERLARKHQVAVIALRQYEKPCRYWLHGAQIINLGAATGENSIKRLIRYWRQISSLRQEYGLPDVIHAFWAQDCGFLAGLVGKQWRKSYILSIGGGEFTWIPQIKYGGQGSWGSRKRIGLAVRSAMLVTAGSRMVLDQIQTRAVKWLPLGVDTVRFQPVIERQVDRPRRLIQVAALNEVKDQSTLLRALSYIREVQPDVHLHLVGQDTLDGRLQSLAIDLSLEKEVTFHGFVKQGELLSLYQQAALYVQSSLYESQGASVLEAAACRVPTVGTDVGLVPELASSAAAAVPVAAPSVLAAEILRLLDDEVQRNEIGEAAMTWAQKHNADWTADQFEVLYRTAAASPV